MIRRTLLLAALALAVFPSAAFAHAQLLSTAPAANALVAHQPSSVSFTFGESVGIDGDAVRVFDRDGRRVDTGASFHPAGRGPTVAVRLRPGLPRGTYTATYRVVSADTHIVTGGVVFSVGARSRTGAPALSSLLSGERAGPATTTAFAATRGVQYAAVGTGAGLLAFLLLVWIPALQGAGIGPEQWRRASARALRRIRGVLCAVAGAGALSAAAGIVLQGAEARGVSFWSAADSTTLADVLPTRFGTVWGAGFIAWIVVLLGAAGAGLRPAPTGLLPRPATVGATGVALPATRSRWPAALLGLPLTALLALPALAGHAAIQHPVALFAPINILHVAAMSIWLGGLIGLLCAALTLPDGSTEDPGAATRALAIALRRFSPAALGCVGVLIATGTVQAIIELSAWSQFVDTGYGRAILVKIVALAGLIALGARQRRRTIPAITSRAEHGQAPASARRLLVETLGLELAVLAVVFGAVGSLAGSAPGREHGAAAGGHGGAMSGMGAMPGMAMSGSHGGPARTITRLGAARLALSVAPATVGQNTITIALTDPHTGRPFAATKQLTLAAGLPRRSIGPLTIALRRVAPGRYRSAGAVLGAPGTWSLTITDRTSEFEESQRSLRVPIK